MNLLSLVNFEDITRNENRNLHKEGQNPPHAGSIQSVLTKAILDLIRLGRLSSMVIQGLIQLGHLYISLIITDY